MVLQEKLFSWERERETVDTQLLSPLAVDRWASPKQIAVIYLEFQSRSLSSACMHGKVAFDRRKDAYQFKVG